MHALGLVPRVFPEFGQYPGPVGPFERLPPRNQHVAATVRM